MGRHLVLLLQHAKHLKGNPDPEDSGLDSCFKAAKALNGIFMSLQLPPALGLDSFPGLPLYEGESSWQALLRGRVVPLLDSKLRVFENIASVLSKEMDASRQKIAAFRGQRGLDQDTIRGLELKVNGSKHLAGSYSSGTKHLLCIPRVPDFDPWHCHLNKPQ